MSGIREWNGASYDRISGPQQAMGRAVLDRMQLVGDERVLDAGCGSGRITQALVECLPTGNVIAVDASDSMVEAARERLRTSAEVRQEDLLELSLNEPVDAILSTATFHWIKDHDLLFARLYAALRPGGRLVAQCGGYGNIDVLRGVAHTILEREPYAERFADWQAPWNYATPERTHERLLNAGFQRAECWLEPSPQQPEHPREFLSTIVLGPHVQHLGPQLGAHFMDEVMVQLGEPVIVDYVRLNIDAVKGS